MGIVTFAGSCRWCGNPDPHLPHTTGQYDTVRHGWLDTFCPGLPGAGAEFKVVGFLPGSAYNPTVFRWTTPDGPAEHPRFYLGERRGAAAQAEADEIYASIRFQIDAARRLAEARERLGPEELNQVEEVVE